MILFNAYKERLDAGGKTVADSVNNTSKTQAFSNIMNSPSLEYVRINSDETDYPCIASNYKTYKAKRFLFLPKHDVSLGSLIYYKEFIYLVTDKQENDIYPEVFGTLCSENFPVITGEEVIEKTDNFGKKKYERQKVYIEVPCVVNPKVYSIVENNMMPLPDGAINILVRYKEGYKIEINQRFRMFDVEYKVTTISYSNIINDEGFVEIRGQRVVTEDDS